MNKGYKTKIYKQDATLIQRTSSFFDEKMVQRWGHAYDIFLKGWLPSNKNVAILEIGCGDGRFLYFLKTRGYTNIQGVDISPQQVELAKQVIENVIEADAIKYLSNHPDSFDLIVGLDIIEHFKKDEVLLFLQACYKALQSGGRLILQTPNAESPWGIKVRYADFTHELIFDPCCLKKLLELGGFARIELRPAEPVVHGILSLIRFLIWKIIWFLLVLWNLAETGSLGSGIYTRVFLISGIKQGR